MDGTLLIWTMLAGVGVLVMALVAVVVARSLDGRTSPAPAGRDAGEGSVAGFSAAVAETLAALRAFKGGDKAKTAESTKKAVSGFVAVGTSLAVVGAVIAVVTDFNDGDVAPVVSELSAGALKGTMVSVRESDPVVLIVPGSGPTDRDGNGPMIRTDAYKLLAEGLADRRIATVRIDKRGMFGSAEAGDPNAVTPDIYAADIHAWIDAIKAARGSKCVFLLGHSEGALMVSIAAAGRKDVCGLILLAGMGRTMSDVIREQLRSNPANAPILDEAMAALAELEAGRDVDTTTMTPVLLPLFNAPVQGYLKSVLTVDPVEAVRRAGKQTLILQGDRDIQVGVDDATLLDKAPKTKLRIIKGMNHVLKEAPEERAGNLAAYADPSLPLADGLIDRIADFVEDTG